MKIAKFKSPLIVSTGKKTFTLNLNRYRNTHYRVSNVAKKNYKDFMSEQILKLKKKLGTSIFIYTVYKGDNRRFDIGNICAIHEKFFEDAIVELNKLEDDKADIIPMVVYVYGGIDIDNPRVEIEVLPLTKKNITKIKTHINNIVEEVADGIM